MNSKKHIYSLFLLAMIPVLAMTLSCAPEPLPDEGEQPPVEQVPGGDTTQDENLGEPPVEEDPSDEEPPADDTTPPGEEPPAEEEPPVDPTPPADDFPEGKAIRILAIGNSFSIDAMEYLYGILKDLGYETIVLGNFYEAGCLVQEHAEWFRNNTASKYTYYYNATGGEGLTIEDCTTDGKVDYSKMRGWVKNTMAPHTALEEDWDFITIQQGSKDSGKPETYDPYLRELTDFVSLENPDAELVWHMTWAYQGNSTHSAFPDYGSNQMTMYNAIVNAVKTKVLPLDVFSKVIPNGTAIQNLRTSYLLDNLTRDGYHLSLREGRYAAALTFAKVLTGCDLSEITYTPQEYEYDDLVINAIKDAVDKACASPYSVTASAYPITDYMDNAPFTNENFETVPGNLGEWK